ncbi:hypothetical protein IQ22_02278 [Pseudomonas duriflava]|uniref:Uncharacterized protein n=1 Tax=Pseudomonas duriflava TaxID=459528 RepID=A0A562QAC3_9PSED|nr:hypothetical protein IQ22_02278 [Pseudomonas duriflava]
MPSNRSLNPLDFLGMPAFIALALVILWSYLHAHERPQAAQPFKATRLPQLVGQL